MGHRWANLAIYFVRKTKYIYIICGLKKQVTELESKKFRRIVIRARNISIHLIYAG